MTAPRDLEMADLSARLKACEEECRELLERCERNVVVISALRQALEAAPEPMTEDISYNKQEPIFAPYDPNYADWFHGARARVLGKG